MKYICRVVVLVATCLVIGVTAASADVRWYLYSLRIRSGESRYAGEITVGKVIKAGYIEVVTDGLGRITRETGFWEGKKTGEIVYQFSPGAKFADAYEEYAATGVLTSRGRIQRNGAGERTRVDTFSTTGDLTAYLVRTMGPDSADEVSYTAKGTRTNRTVIFYSPAGVRVRGRYYPEDATYYDSEYDPGTNLRLSRKKLVNEKLAATNKYAYDSYGDLTRDDVYTAEGVWYGAREYSELLLTVRHYKFSDGRSEETTFTYDGDRRTKAAVYKVNGQLICTFTYDRLSTGAVKRTLAVGPDGQLFAEYPEMAVDNVDRTGHPVDHQDLGTIYRKTNWW